MLAASTLPLAYTTQSSHRGLAQCKPGLTPCQHRARKLLPATRVGLDERMESQPAAPAWQHLQHKHTQQQPPHQQAAIQPEVPQIFDYEHFPRVDLPMLAYFPLGVALAFSRVLLWVLCIAIDLPVFRNRNVVDAYLALLGVKVTWHNLHLLPKGFHVMVSNHTNCGDLMALFTLPQRYIHLISPAIPAKAMNTQNLPVVLRPAVLDTYDAIAAESAESSSASPVHLFPEGAMTNGAGMLQFSRGFTKFSRPGTPVVPVALKTHIPWGIRTHTLTSSFALNLLLYSFCPQVHIEAVVLPPMVQGQGDGGAHEGEGRGAFVKRVQGAIAEHLNVPITDVTIHQKRQMMREYEKKRRGA
ncbi:hypothetical protein DUNSADRAFT_11913 [Dunaliella salina]|uniref:Phospholipid/glycerol acyltransferase domain-containing protein n=1 Tax=Dunaliella salina TaxID=3046 RepID=A0ABQ7GCD1_DUNSA|nr:hypothetical protein DUNSADRAFT_11913 [Dunaliella salina]|eukprot:KAF5832270.1 hypothetical protein DUNSADRAFT_11913 [Dunaliella salina]